MLSPARFARVAVPRSAAPAPAWNIARRKGRRCYVGGKAGLLAEPGALAARIGGADPASAHALDRIGLVAGVHGHDGLAERLQARCDRFERGAALDRDAGAHADQLSHGNRL